MPDLPRTWINDQALYDRAVAAFPGETLAEKAKAYRQWHLKALRGRVLELETQAIIRSNALQVQLLDEELSGIENSNTE